MKWIHGLFHIFPINARKTAQIHHKCALLHAHLFILLPGSLLSAPSLRVHHVLDRKQPYTPLYYAKYRLFCIFLHSCKLWERGSQKKKEKKKGAVIKMLVAKWPLRARLFPANKQQSDGAFSNLWPWGGTLGANQEASRCRDVVVTLGARLVGYGY